MIGTMGSRHERRGIRLGDRILCRRRTAPCAIVVTSLMAAQRELGEDIDGWLETCM